MVRKFLILTAMTGAVAAGLSGAAFADGDFCGDAGSCRDMGVYNRSAALVTSVVITQEKTDGACTLDERKFTKNLNGLGGENMDGDGFTVSANTKCKYKIKFKTTSGCTGDKTAHMKPGNFAENKTYVELKNGCGTLDTRKG